MSSSAIRRLPSLLQSFQLPAGATAADLKQAYLREAKRLHPDRRAAGERAFAEKEFVELQQRFDECLHLIGKRGTCQSPHVCPPWGTGVSKRKGGSAYAAPDSRGTWRASDSYSGSASLLPSQGLPAQHVYFAAFVAAVAGLVMLRRGNTNTQSAAQAAASSARDAYEPLPIRRPNAQQPKHVTAKEAWQNASSNPKGPHAAPIAVLPLPLAEDLAFSEQSCKGHEMISDGRSEEQVARDLAKYFGLQQHRTKARRTSSSRVSPQVRDGVAVTAAHVASEDGRVWWLEQCGASRCRRGLEDADRRGDTPLHRCAKSGQAPTCHALLRAGADPAMENNSRLLPEDLASHEGYAELAETLRGLRQSHARRGCEPGCSKVHGNGELCSLCGERYGQHVRHRCRNGNRGSFPIKAPSLRSGQTDLLADPTTQLTRRYEVASDLEEQQVSPQYLHATFQGNLLLRLKAMHAKPEPPLAAWETILQHPDGLGLLAAPPESVPYDGPRPNEILRRAVNFAAGAVVLEQNLLERQGSRDFSIPLDHARAVHFTPAPRRLGSDVDEEASIRRASDALERFGLFLEPANAEATGARWVDCIGMLVFEPEGSGSEDAPPHWAAVRSSGSEFWRLDPVRGSFRMSPQEFAELRCRYNAWRIVRRISAEACTR